MNLDHLHFLLTLEGERLLEETSQTPITPENHLQIATHLRQGVEPEIAQAILETVLLRQIAAAKFSRAAQMFFVKPALEQASAEIVSTYRARRFQEGGFDVIADLGCGIGGDSLALAAHAEVTGIDWDPVRVAMAQENVRVYDHGERFHPLQADLMALSQLSEQAFFFDPARRDDLGRRFFSVYEYQPPLTIIERWLEKVPHAAVKISPGVDYAELPDGAEVEFISVKGEVKEGVLWFGNLKSGVKRRATLFPGGHTLSSAEIGIKAVDCASPKAYLYEPDKAVIRAHLVEVLAWRLGANKIDSDIAYLTADSYDPSPFASCYLIEDVIPFQLKRLRHYLRERQIGHVTIKKRGSPLEPDWLERQLRLRGEAHRIVFLTQIMGEAAVIIGQRIHKESNLG